ncbi:MAG TPA: hypothetical protein VJX66_14685 [Amycolatopsis sp.]|nr:hypothetical protein [Amycolatopsis sp.]
MAPRPLLAALFVTAGLLLTACGSDAGSSALPTGTFGPEDGGHTGFPIYSGTLTLSGGLTATSDWTNSSIGLLAKKTCQDIGANGNGGNGNGPEGSFQIPGPAYGRKTNGQNISLSVSVKKYHGPGDYPREELTGHVQLIDSNNGRNFDVAEGSATSQATIAADGSGTLTFANVPDPDHADTPALSGSVTWKCTV